MYNNKLTKMFVNSMLPLLSLVCIEIMVMSLVYSVFLVCGVYLVLQICKSSENLSIFFTTSARKDDNKWTQNNCKLINIVKKK
jgi:archaellum biogenesis protein FlaJ (TadC family)